MSRIDKIAEYAGTDWTASIYMTVETMLFASGNTLEVPTTMQFELYIKRYLTGQQYELSDLINDKAARGVLVVSSVSGDKNIDGPLIGQSLLVATGPFFIPRKYLVSFTRNTYVERIAMGPDQKVVPAYYSPTLEEIEAPLLRSNHEN